MSAPDDLAGWREFRVELAAVNAETRLFRAEWGQNGTVVRYGDRREAYEITPETAGFGLVQGREAPVLFNHQHDLDNSLGILEAGWVENGRVRLIGRLGHGPIADRIYRDMIAGIPFGCSAGVVQPAPERRVDSSGDYWLFRSFEITELSLLPLHAGWDRTARAVANDHAYTMLLLEQQIGRDEIDRWRNALDAAGAERLRGLAGALAELAAQGFGVEPAQDQLAKARALIEEVLGRFSQDTRLDLDNLLRAA